MTEVTFTHVGGPTLLIEFEVSGCSPIRPSTRPAGSTTSAGAPRRPRSPACALPEEIGPVDVVLLTHDHHDDNLDAAGRAFLKDVPLVVTTASGATRIGGTGLRPEQSTTLNGDQDHRHPLPPRAAAEPPHRRRRHRVRPRMAGSDAWPVVDHGRHGPVRPGARDRPPPQARARSSPPRWRAVPDHRAAALHR